MTRVTRKMMNSNSIYNINSNKEVLDKKNTQMATQKKFVDPSDDPITAIRSLRYKGNLSEVSQYLDRNVSDAISWNESTQASLDTAVELMRSLKAEYTSAANGTNEIKDRRIYYQNMENLVNEYFSIGNTSIEARHLFTGYRTDDSLTFSAADFDKRKNSSEDGKFYYKDIEEYFEPSKIETYTFTSRKGDAFAIDKDSGVTNQEILEYLSVDTNKVNETNIENVQAYRLRLSYEKIDEVETDDEGRPLEDIFIKTFKEEDGGLTLLSSIKVTNIITEDTEVNSDLLTGNEVYLNARTGNLIFGDAIRDKLTASSVERIGFTYDKSEWSVGDVKPEYYFKCSEERKIDPVPDVTEYYAFDGMKLKFDNMQELDFNMGDSQAVRINTNASEAFTIDARRDLNELRDALNLWEAAQSKVERLKTMSENEGKYPDPGKKIPDLLYAAEKELEYAQSRVDDMLSRGMTRADRYFDMASKASTAAGSVAKRLELISRRLSADKITIQTQTSDNENVDLSVLAVDVSEASLLYSAALQVTGKIGQQSLINYI